MANFSCIIEEMKNAPALTEAEIERWHEADMAAADAPQATPAVPAPTPAPEPALGGIFSDAAAMPNGATPAEVEAVRRQQLRAGLEPKRAKLMASAKDPATVPLPTRADYLIKDILGSEGLSFFYAPSHAGKTFIVLDMALHIAARMPWMGQPVSKRAGRVLYIPQEGEGTIDTRLVALRVAKPEVVEAAEGRFTCLPHAVDLSDEENRMLIEMEIESGEYSMVIIDTLAASLGESDENSSRDTSLFMTRLRGMLPQGKACQFMLLAHPGKDSERGMRGSSALKASADTMLAIKQSEGGATSLMVEKLRAGESEKTFPFELVRMVLGQNDEGEEITSRHLRFLSGAEVQARSKVVKPKPAKLGELQWATLRAVVAAIEDHGVKKRPHEEYPMKSLCVSRDQIQDKLADIIKADRESTPHAEHKLSPEREAQSRIRRSLEALEGKSKRLIAHHEEFFWIADDEKVGATMDAYYIESGLTMLNGPTKTSTDDGRETFSEESDMSTDDGAEIPWSEA